MKRRHRIRRGVAITRSLQGSLAMLTGAGLHRRARMLRREIERSFDRYADDAQLDRWAQRASVIEHDTRRAIARVARA